MANPSNLHICGVWEETGARADSAQTVTQGREWNPGPWRCEAAVLTTVPPQSWVGGRVSYEEDAKAHRAMDTTREIGRYSSAPNVN